jgi:hypothetical protein
VIWCAGSCCVCGGGFYTDGFDQVVSAFPRSPFGFHRFQVQPDVLLMLQEVTSSFASGYLCAAAAAAAAAASFSANHRFGVIFAAKKGAPCGLSLAYRGELQLVAAECVALKEALCRLLPQLAADCR